MRLARFVPAASAAMLLACGGRTASVTPAPAASAEAPAAVVSEPLTDARVLALGRGYVELLRAREYDAIWSRLTPEAQGRFSDREAFRTAMAENLDALGDEVGVLREAVEQPRAGMLANRLYFRVSRYARAADAPVSLLIGLKHDGSIVGMQVRRAE